MDLQPPNHSSEEPYSVKAESFDFAEKQDVIVTHRALYGTTYPSGISLEALPPLFYFFCGLALFILGTSFSTFNMTLSLDKGPGGPLSPIIPFVPVPPTPDEIGASTFKGNCVACHQASGLGQAGNVPPLAGSDWVQGDPNRLVCILTKGLQGPVKVNGATYNAQMPAYPAFSPDQLADLLTYIRKDWTNKAPPVTEDVVTKERAAAPPPAGGAYTEDELLKIQ